MTHFERLGLPRRFRLDAAELERNYLARSREVHPDFTGNDPAEPARFRGAERGVRDACAILSAGRSIC